MTKALRIENADTSTYDVIVEVWQKRKDGDFLESTHELNNPCQMLLTYIYFDTYIVIKERSKNINVFS